MAVITESGTNANIQASSKLLTECLWEAGLDSECGLIPEHVLSQFSICYKQHIFASQQ